MSIGIIGGADGPTQIFVASSAFGPLLLGIIAFALAAVIAFIIYRRREDE